MSATINLTNVTAAKGYGGVDLVAIYGQGGVKIWEDEPPRNYANDPFTIVAKSAGDINIKIGNYYVQSEESDGESGSGSGDGESPSVVEVTYDLEYSTDGGTTWDIGYVMLGDEMTFTVQAGDEIMLRNDSVVVASDPNNFDLQKPIRILPSTTASFELQGNIMSLIYGDYF
jgi:hypothetical protein